MLRKQVFTLENQDDDISPEKRQDMIKAELEYQISLYKSQF